MISDAVNNPLPLPKLHIEHTPFSTVLHEFCGVSFDHRRHHGSAGGHILVVHPHGTIQHNDPGEKNSGRVANLTKDGWIKPSFVDGWRTKNDKLLWSYWWRVTTSENRKLPKTNLHPTKFVVPAGVIQYPACNSPKTSMDHLQTTQLFKCCWKPFGTTSIKFCFKMVLVPSDGWKTDRTIRSLALLWPNRPNRWSAPPFGPLLASSQKGDQAAKGVPH